MQRRQRFIADQRFDLPQYDSMMRYISDEFRAYNKGFLSPLSRIVSGWKVESNGGLSVRVNNITSSLLFASEKPGVAGVNYREAGDELLTLTLADNAVNFVEVQIVSSTCAPDTVALWDTTANSGAGEEYTQLVDTAHEERPVLVSNTISFSGDADKVPLAIVTTSGGVIVSVVDSRKFLFQLESDWNFGSTRSDKTIGNLKNAYDAITTSIKEMKGSSEWYAKPFASTKILKEYQNLFISGGGTIQWQGSAGTDNLAWSSDFDIEIADRAWSYNLPAGSVALLEGQALYIDIPVGEPLAPLTAQVANLADVPIDPSSANHSAGIQVLFFRRSNKIISTTLDMPDLNSGEGSTVGEDLPQSVRTRLGVTSTEGYAPYTSTTVIAVNDSYATALSKLDAQIAIMLASNPDEQVIEVTAPSGQTVFTFSSIVFNPNNTIADIIVSVNGQIVEVDRLGGLAKDYRKTSSNQIEFAYSVPTNAKVKAWKDVAGGGGGGGGGGTVAVQEDGTVVTSSATVLNFIGNGVTAQLAAPGVVEVVVNTSSATNLKKLVKNDTGATIPAFSCLTWEPDGTVALADADLPNKSLFAGINETAIPDGQYGFVVRQGNVAGALAALGCAPGDTIFIGETPGELTKNPPLDLSDTIFKVGRAEPPDGFAQPDAIDLYLEPEVISTPS